MNVADFPRVGLPEAIQRLESLPPFLAAAIQRADAAELGRRVVPEEFSLVEQACHLRDVEREGYLLRVRRMLSEDAPDLAGFDGGAVAQQRDYARQDARSAAAEFSAARRELLGIVATLTPAQLAREATFGGKRICMVDLIGMILAHDAEHRAEIERLGRALWK